MNSRCKDKQSAIGYEPKKEAEIRQKHHEKRDEISKVQEVFK